MMGRSDASEYLCSGQADTISGRCLTSCQRSQQPGIHRDRHDGRNSQNEREHAEQRNMPRPSFTIEKQHNEGNRCRLQSDERLKKYDELAKILTGNSSAVATDGVTWTENLVHELRIPKLSQFGVNKNDFETLSNKAKVASSMKGNPVKLADDKLLRILEKSV